MANIPVINDHPQVVTQPEDKQPVIPADAVKDHGLHLSQNMKLSTRHIDFKEKAISVDDEWKWVNGEAVPPVGRTTNQYTVTEPNKYSSYGDVKVVSAVPYVNDPAKEVTETLTITAPTTTTNDDPDFIEAVPVLAVNKEQSKYVLTEGRHGEVEFDPITAENYLTRPGMEVKTSETYMGPDNFKCSVTLNKNGGTLVAGETDVTEYTEGTETTLPLLEKADVTFDGWYKKEDFSGDKFTKISKTDKGDLTFYAKFVAARGRKAAAKSTTAE